MSNNIVSEIQLDPNDATKTTWGALIADEFYFAWINGGQGDSSFDVSTDVSQSTRNLMDQYARGVWIDLGAGVNQAVGSAYADTFTMGSGTGFFDGGADVGSTPWGSDAQDMLDVYLTSVNQSVSITRVTSGDGVQAQDYSYKVEVVGGGSGVAFVKNIEAVNVHIWNDTNSDGQRDWSSEVSYQQFIPLAISVNEIRLDSNDSTKTAWGDSLSGQGHFAWVNGGLGDDSFDASVDISAATLSLMTQYERGVWLDLGSGVNEAVGTDYADSFTMGTGTNYFDGGGNSGRTPWGANAQDTLDVYLTDPSQAVDVSDVTIADGPDVQAYTFKISIDGGNGGTAFIKNIEGINVQRWNDADNDGERDWVSEVTYQRFIPLTLNVNELRLNPNDSTRTEWGDLVANQFHFAWVEGGQADDDFDASRDISASTRTLMDQYEGGVSVDLGAGTNEAVGSDYADNFVLGPGVNYIDGGGNSGTTPWGSSAQDTLDVFLTNANQTVSIDQITEADGLKAQDYTYKVSVLGDAGGVSYVKNIEGINVQLWTDANSDGLRDWGTELTYQQFIPLTVSVNEIQIDPNDPSRTSWGDSLEDQYHFAWVSGGLADDSFYAVSDISATTLDLMDEYQRGIWVELGNGTNTVAGSAYADNFSLGFGTDFIDGGANGGTTPWGANGQDILDIYITSDDQTVTVSQVTEEDIQAAQPYDYKVSISGTDRVAYLKDVEGINVQLWIDSDGDGQRDWDTEVTYKKFVPLAVNVNEIRLDPDNTSLTEWGDPLQNQGHFAWVSGGFADDNFDFSVDISDSTKTLMSTYERGVSVDLGDGVNVAVGSTYADNFVMGFGTDYIDGGGNVGEMPWGGRAQDSLDVYLTSLTQKVSLSEISESDGLQAQSYQYKVTVDGRSGTAFIKGIEALNVQFWDDKNGNGEIDWDQNELSYQQFIPLSLTINEVRVDPNDSSMSEWGMPLAEQFHFAWVNGGLGDDSFDASVDISEATQALMTTYQRGISVDLGNGVNTAIGTAYADNFTMGTGTEFIDGGDNLGTNPWGGGDVQDILDVYITSADQTVSLTPVTEQDGVLARGYTYKVSAEGTPGVAYIKNIEAINVQLWIDKDGDGVREWYSDDNNELTYVDYIPLGLNIFEDPTGQFHVAHVNGGPADDAFNPALFSSSIVDVMNTRQIGASFDLGEGNDNALGTDYSDTFRMGSGVNFVDGGNDLGSSSWGGRDVIEVFITSEAERSGISVTDLDGSGSTQDIVAHGQGYTQKLVSTATNETTYFKNVELVLVQLWNDANGNNMIDWGDNEVNWIEQILTAPYVIPNLPAPTLNSPSIGFVFGTASDETFVGNSIASQDFGIQPENLEFGVYVYSGRGLNTMVGTALNDTLGVEQIGSNLIDGGADEGYFRFDSVVRMHSDMYRFFIEQPMPKTSASDTAGGYTAADLNLANYRLVDVRDWTDTLTGIDSNTTGLLNKLPGAGELTDADLDAIGQQAQALSIDQANSLEGIDWVVVKRDIDGGDVSGVDFLKDIESMQFVLWYDRVDDGRPSGGARETVTGATFELEVDSFILSEADFEAQILGSRAGTVLGSIFDDVIDVSQEITLAGFRLFDEWGDDQVTGTNFDDFFILGRGNDALDGAGGTDRVGVSWVPSDGSAELSIGELTIDGVTTFVITENSDQGSIDLLTLALTGEGDWTLSTLESDNSDSTIKPLNDGSGSIGTNTLSNMEYFSIYQNGITSDPAAVDLELGAMFLS